MSEEQTNPAPETEAQTERAAFFDFDDTVFYGDSILYWSVYLIRRHPLLWFWRIPYLLSLPLWLAGLLNTPFLKRLALWPASWISAEERETLAREFVDKLVPQYLYPEIARRMRKHRAEGLKVIVLTASPNLWARHLSDMLPADEVRGTDMEFPSTGLRLPRYVGRNFKGRDKVIWILSQARFPRDGKGCWAYSDGGSDLPMLRYAEHPVAVHPTPKLAREAAKNDWPVLRPCRPREGIRRLAVKLEMLLWAHHLPVPLQRVSADADDML